MSQSQRRKLRKLARERKTLRKLQAIVDSQSDGQEKEVKRLLREAEKGKASRRV